ncbi:MAG: HAD-IA family hydrolase [Myxococcaceae bacterium]|nr:HAD-IA family hydrolase [Myxococcaceae bacterium]
MPRIDTLLLDLGNVLVFHDNALLVRNLAERAAADPAPLTEALRGELSVMINEGALSPNAIREEVCRLLGGVNIPMPEFFELWSSHFTLNEAVFPRIDQLAESKRVKLVLVSNTNALHWEWLLPRVPVLRHFTACVVSHEVHAAKPRPEIFHEALFQARTPPTRAAFFDDIPEYVAAASALGIHGRVFTTAEHFDVQLRELGFIP